MKESIPDKILEVLFIEGHARFYHVIDLLSRSRSNVNIHLQDLVSRKLVKRTSTHDDTLKRRVPIYSLTFKGMRMVRNALGTSGFAKLLLQHESLAIQLREKFRPFHDYFASHGVPERDIHELFPRFLEVEHAEDDFEHHVRELYVALYHVVHNTPHDPPIHLSLNAVLEKFKIDPTSIDAKRIDLFIEMLTDDGFRLPLNGDMYYLTRLDERWELITIIINEEIRDHYMMAGFENKAIDVDRIVMNIMIKALHDFTMMHQQFAKPLEKEIRKKVETIVKKFDEMEKRD